jgi:aryl-alcohol dehydrogenase
LKIRAAVVWEKSGPFAVEELEMEEPRADEVRVRVVGVGVCHTDFSVRDQFYPVPLPAVLGHEASGVVEQVGRHVAKVEPGDHVVLTYLLCGTCRNCVQGKPAYCLYTFPYNFGGARLDQSTALPKGSDAIHSHFFGQSSCATHVLASERNVVKVRKNVPLELLGPLGCGIQTGAGAVLNSVRPAAGSSIVVFGTGSVGMSAVMAARVAGCTTIIGVDIQSNRLNAARELGATHTINPEEIPDPVGEIQKITGGGADYSLDTTVSPKVFRQAVDCLIVTGICGLIGGAALGTEVTFDMNTILFGRTVRGIIEGDSIPEIFIPRLIDLYTQGRFPFDRLIRKYQFEEINQAVQDSEQGQVFKPVLMMAG